MKKILWIILAFAVILRVCLFIFVEKSLWLDEAALALNVLDKNYIELFQPLQYAQSAPPLFLCLVKILTSIFGFSERAFRFIPFIASICSVFGFYYLLKALFYNKGDEFKKDITFLFICCAMCSFVVSFPLLYNTIEFKPYIFDVLFTILTALIWFKYLNRDLNLKKQICFAMLLSLFPLFSFGSIFSLFAILILSILKKRKSFSFILIFGLFVEYLFIFSKISAGTRVYEYWLPYFVSHNPLKIPFVLADILNYYFSSFRLLGLILFIIGCIVLFRKNKKVFNYFGLIIAGGFLASFFNFYPLYERLSLFLYPIVLIIILSPLCYIFF